MTQMFSQSVRSDQIRDDRATYGVVRQHQRR
jgi:hypothetical protein